MRARELLHNFFDSTCRIDKRIKKALFAASESLLSCKNLSIQSNTEKKRNVLSNITIGWQMLQRSEIKLNIKDFNFEEMLKTLIQPEDKIFC